MRILIAMDKLKGTATAAEACDAVGRGILRAAPAARVRSLPMADGGDGTLDALLVAGYERDDLAVHDAYGQPIGARGARLGDRWLIEVAEICGLGARRPTPEMAERADSSGIGEAMLHALDTGATEIRIALGGSATSDGGAGMLQRLGARFRDHSGGTVAVGGSALAELDHIDWTGLDPRLYRVDIVGLCDVDAPLRGPLGAAAVYGPQKGADPAAIARIEAGLTRFADVVAAIDPPHGPVDAADPGVGAAGGLGWGLRLIGARLVSGGSIVADALGLADAVADADLVVTGEGRLDEQSIAGKTPAVVAAVAAACSVPVMAVVGQDDLGADASRLGFERVYALTDYASHTDRDPALTLRALELAGAALALELLADTPTDASAD